VLPKARYFASAAALVVASVLVRVGPAGADTASECDESFDAAVTTADFLCVEVSFSRRIHVSAEFTQVGPWPEGNAPEPTVFRMMIDPARFRAGPRFRLRVHTHPDRTATGRLLMASSPGSQYNMIRCADVRAEWFFAGDDVTASVPSRCLRRHTRLGDQARVRLRSFDGGDGDYLRDPPKTFEVTRG